MGRSKRPPFQNYTILCSAFPTWADRKDPHFKKNVCFFVIFSSKIPCFSREWPPWKPPPPIFSEGPLPKPPPPFFKPCAAHIYQFHIWVPPPTPGVGTNIFFAPCLRKRHYKILGTGQNCGSVGKQQTNNFLRSTYVFLSVPPFIFRRTSYNPWVRASPPPGRNDRTILPTTNRNLNIFTVIQSLTFSLSLT